MKKGSKKCQLRCSMLKIRRCLCGSLDSMPSPVQWIEDLVLPQLWYRSQQWLRFSPWPGNFHVLWVQPKKKKKGQLVFKTPQMEWWLQLYSCVFPPPHSLGRDWEVMLDRIAQLDHVGKCKTGDNWNSFFWFMFLAEKLCILEVTLFDWLLLI